MWADVLLIGAPGSGQALLISEPTLFISPCDDDVTLWRAVAALGFTMVQLQGSPTSTTSSPGSASSAGSGEAFGSGSEKGTSVGDAVRIWGLGQQGRVWLANDLISLPVLSGCEDNFASAVRVYERALVVSRHVLALVPMPEHQVRQLFDLS